MSLLVAPSSVILSYLLVVNLMVSTALVKTILTHSLILSSTKATSNFL